MNTKNSVQIEVDNNQHNLDLLQKLYDQNADFVAYAQCINELFYYYVQHCTAQADDFFLYPEDVQHVLEVVNTLQRLKEPV